MAEKDNVELQIRAKNLTKEAFAKVSEALKALEDQQEQTTGKGSTSWGKLFGVISGGVAVGNLISGAFSTVGRLLASIPGQLLEIAKRGGDVSDIRASFNSLNAAIGESADTMLGKLRSAFGHTVTDFDLMKSSNELLSRGVRVTATDMETMAKASRAMAEQVGGPAKDKFDSFLSAIGRGNEKELKQLPINMGNIERAVKKHADALGLEEAKLTVNQRQHALRNAVLQESTRILKENGEVTNDFGDNLVATEVLIQNWKDRLGEAIATSPQLNVALGHITEAMQAAFGADNQTQVKNIARLIGQAAVAAVTGASWMVSAASTITSAYYKARAAVDTLFKSFNDREIREVQTAIANIRKAYGDALPQHAIRRLAEYQDRLNYLKGYSQGLNDDANESLATGAKLNRMAADAQQWLAKLRTDMAAAGDATGETAKKVTTLTNSANGAGDSVGALAEKTKKYLQTLRELNAQIENRKDLSDRALVDRFGKEAQKAIQEARDLGIALDKIPPKIVKLGDAQGARELAEILAKIPPAVSGIGDLIDALDKQMFELTGKSNAGWVELRDGMVDAQDRMTLAVQQGTQKRLTEIAIAEKKVLASFANLAVNEPLFYAIRFAATKAFYQLQRDEANGTASTLEERMTKLGFHTKEVLDQQAADAKRDYDQMLKSGKYSSQQLQIAWERMVNANIAAQGKWGSTFNKWIGSIPSMLQSAFSGGGGFGGFAKSLTSMIGGDIGKGMFEEGGMFGGFTKNLLDGKGALSKVFGKTFSGALGAALPGIGSALGALAGPLIGKIGSWFKGLFSSPEWKKVKAEVSKDLGEGISDGLAKQIAEIAKTIEGGTKNQRRKIAELLSLSSIIQEQGGIGKADVDRYAKQAIQLFDVIARGGKEAGKAREELGKVFSQLVEASGATKQIANQSLIDIVQQAERTGQSIKEVSSFIKDMDAKAAGGFNKLAGGFGSMISKAVKDGQRVRADLAKANDDWADLVRRAEEAEGAGRTTEALDLRAQAGETGRQIQTLQSQISFFDRTLLQAGDTGQASFDRLGRFALLAAENIRASGGSLFDVFDQIGVGLDSLGAAQDTYYFSANDGALQNLLAVRRVLTTHEELGQMVVGLNELMVGTANRGRINQGVFTDLGTQAVENQRAMEAAGLTTEQALDAQRDTLQGLFELQQRYNLTLGEQEQLLLDDARAAGIVGEAHKSASERMVDGINKVVTRLDALLEKLGVKLPAAISNIPRAIDIDVNYRENGRPNFDQVDTGSGGDYASTYDVPGSDAGGLFTKPTFRVFAERQPEIAGSPNVIVDALVTAMKKTGGLGGQGEASIFVITTAGGVDGVMNEVKQRLGRAIRFNEGNLRDVIRDVVGAR